MNEIIPTILTSDINEFTKKINLVSNIVPWVQIDVIDGRFAPKKTVHLEEMKDLVDMRNLRLDLHLMVEKPEEWVHRCLEILPERVIAQVEKTVRLEEFLQKTIEGGVQVGIALDLETPVEAVPEEVYTQCDLVLVMGVKAGDSGQEFAPVVLEKIRKIKKMVGELVEIGVDGGLNEKNLVYCKEAGATVFYVGSAFWQAKNLEERYWQLKKLVE